jgi:hypothetical protein
MTAREANMTSRAFAERLEGKLQPTRNGSTYVHPKQMEWQKSQFDGISMKVLYRDDHSAR